MDLSCDIVGPLPKSNGFSYLFSIVDRVTRWAECIPLVAATADACAEAFIYGWAQRFGLPHAMSSDQGNTFVANLWKNLQKTLDVEVKFSPLYSPQSNGLIERQHRTIKESLKAALHSMGDTHKEKWYYQLPWTMLGRRAAFQPDLGASPSQLTMGSCPILPGMLVNDPGPPLKDPEIKHLLETLQMEAQRPSIPTSSHSSSLVQSLDDPEAKEATHVYCRVDNAKSLMPRWSGPFEIVERPSHSTIKIRTGTYVSGKPMLELQSWTRCKPAFMRQDAPLASRARRGRPKTKDIEPPSDPRPTSPPAKSLLTQPVELVDVKQTNLPAKSERENSNDDSRPIRSTRNQNPNYVDSIGPPPIQPFPHKPQAWSATYEDLSRLNNEINAPRRYHS